jgi:ABC-type Fe3+ transport system permease subunit
MGMAVVFDVASEKVGQYPVDMTLCGAATARVSASAGIDSDSTRSSHDNDDGLSKSNSIIVAVLATFASTLLICLVLFFVLRGASKDSEVRANFATNADL